MAAVKDGKPKRPMSAYMFFATEERPKVKKVQPAWNILEIAKELGQRWNVLLPQGKARYEGLARKDKERYEREGGGRKERKGPKRPQSAYMFFVQEERIKLVKEHSTWTVPQVGSELGKRWRALNANQKKKYEVLAQGDKGRYEREMGRAPSAASGGSASSSPTGNSSSSPVNKEKKSVKAGKVAASPKKSPAKSGKSSASPAPGEKSKSPRKIKKEEKPAPKKSKGAKKA